jgi:hypothetical protein
MVCGPPASGKTAVVRALACGLRLPHALVDCSAQHVAQSLLFEDVLARLQPHVPAISVSCSSPAKFVSALRAVCAGRAETTYIVLFLLLSRLLIALLSPESHHVHARTQILDKAERLREASGALLQLLLRLDEVVRAFTPSALTVVGLTFALRPDGMQYRRHPHQQHRVGQVPH